MTNPPDGALRDRRLPPFCYQTVDALALLRAWYLREAPGRLSTALAIYLTLTEHANRNGGHAARGGFTAYRTDIAADAGVSVDTLDRYARELEEIGLLVVEHRQTGRVSLPNCWVLEEPPGRTDTAGVAAPVRPNARVQCLEKKEPKENPPVAPPENRPGTVARRPVTDDEYGLAAQVLGHFNAIFGTHYSDRDNITKIVMRIREHRDLSLDDHEAVMRAVAREPWWSGTTSPAVIYGNGGLFERCMHTAVGAGEGRSNADLIAALGGPVIDARLLDDVLEMEAPDA